MKIGYDAKRAAHNFTGLGNYSRLLIELMASKRPDDRLVLYTPRLSSSLRLAAIDSLENVEWAPPASRFSRAFPSLWRSRGITSQLRADGVDLYHGLSGELPVNIASSGIPSVVTVHDLIFRHFPSGYKAVDRKIYDVKFRHACRNATRIIAISQCTARDISEFYDIDPSKIDIIYQGCDTIFSRPVASEAIADVKARYGLTHPYIICVGTVELRKNQLLVLQALRLLPGDIHLVIVGRHTPYARQITEYASAHSLTPRVHFIEGAPFADLPALYAGALLSAYSSRFEGFGIPVIESLSVGTPVIVASGSCLEEAAGEAAPVVHPDDVEALAGYARRIIEDDEYRCHLVESGQRHIARFSHENFAAAVDNLYTKILTS